MTVYYHVADNRSTNQKGFLILIANSPIMKNQSEQKGVADDTSNIIICEIKR